ncbi:hypothetical protein Slala02_37690 [Streptomyces lavendulae subsp. lavendulae]|nr:hypothetical protein Slala01_50760 [Streptomyces lavendulae subsp. lavendulae]GLX27949.1 hypothetical protein Slala02_37690 [Streptomyces lavendulae subsp. lavendulae]
MSSRIAVHTACAGIRKAGPPLVSVRFIVAVLRLYCNTRRIYERVRKEGLKRGRKRGRKHEEGPGSVSRGLLR